MSELGIEAFHLRNQLADKQRDCANWQRLYERSEEEKERLYECMDRIIIAVKNTRDPEFLSLAIEDAFSDSGIEMDKWRRT